MEEHKQNQTKQTHESSKMHTPNYKQQSSILSY